MSIFSSVPITKLSRSTFNLDHENKLSFNFGGLYPILTHTVLPGDKMSLGIQSFVRTVPLLSPVMHRNDIKVDAFFVPMRLIWKNYEAWLQCSDPTIRMPKLLFDYTNPLDVDVYNKIMGVGSLADYLGFASVPDTAFFKDANGKINTPYSGIRQLNLLPFRAYQLIYNYYYRNKSLEPSVEDYFDNGASLLTPYDITSNNNVVLSNSGIGYLEQMFMLRNRSWRRDPFTSALPNPQKGNPVLMPTGDIVSDGNLKFTSDNGVGGVITNATTGQLASISKQYPSADNRNSADERYYSGLKIDSPTMEDIRYAEVLDEYEEALARAGAGSKDTFKEWLLAIWRTLSPDARLDRPEYLGGYRGPIQISEVPQTSEGTATSAQGTLAGKGLSVGGQRLFGNRTFKEPGYIMVIMSIVPKSSYFQGDPREFLYESPFDFPNPYFANLGEQEVLSQEVNAASALLNSSHQPKAFGYNVRNYEMKQLPDSVHGMLRSNLLYWHEGRKFVDTPPSGDPSLWAATNLNKDFVKMQAEEVSRIFPSIETSDKLIGEFFFSFRAKRSLPYYGVPRIGHTK